MVAAEGGSQRLLVRGGTVVTMDRSYRMLDADVLVKDGRIAAIAPGMKVPAEVPVLDAAGLHVLPGLIQGHVHLGQALFRGLAEGRELLDWLRQRIWPLEAAHTQQSAYWSTMLGAADCLLSGTTTVQEIGLVRCMGGVFEGLRDSGLRAVAGKCLMDSGEGVPPELHEDTNAALEEARDLYARWHRGADGRIRGAICPRFILSCSRELWEGCVELSATLEAPIHTHLLEHAREEEEVKEVLGTGQMEYLDQIGVLDTDLRIAHGVWFGDSHRDILAGRPLGVVHCPSANLKLGSGIADLLFLRSLENLALGVGCDGAPCNNDMDVLEEIRLAALLQCSKQGPGEFSAREALELATIEGARAIGMEREVGSIEVGKFADFALLDLERPATFGPSQVSVYDRIVYGAARDAVRYVVIGGSIRVDAGRLPHFDEDALARRPAEEIEQLLRRARLQ